jgi:hypothetical protein
MHGRFLSLRLSTLTGSPAGLWASLPEARRREAVRTLSMLLERSVTAPGPMIGRSGGEHDVAD